MAIHIYSRFRRMEEGRRRCFMLSDKNAAKASFACTWSGIQLICLSYPPLLCLWYLPKIRQPNFTESLSFSAHTTAEKNERRNLRSNWTRLGNWIRVSCSVTVAVHSNGRMISEVLFAVVFSFNRAMIVVSTALEQDIAGEMFIDSLRRQNS